MTKRHLGVFIITIFLMAFYKLCYADPIITNPISSYDPTQFYFTYIASAPEDFFRVYIDNTQNANTGFPVGGIGAKYLLENSVLYSYVGPGWKWNIVKTEPYYMSNNQPQWTIGRNDVGNNNCAGAINYVFQIQVGSTIVTGNKGTLNFPANPSCVIPPPPVTQSIAVPSYFWPNCANNPNCDWNRMASGAPKVALTVINPNSGAGSYIDPAFVSAVQNEHKAGATVIGYVDTNYANRPIAAIANEINNYYAWYNVDGIFFDQAYGSDCTRLTYYKQLNQLVKAKGGKGITMVNYGANPPQCYIDASDILITYEGTYSDYVNFKPSPWEMNYPPNRFYHVIYAASQDQLQDAITRSRNNRAGWIYVTPLTVPNPYQALPIATYWTTELNIVY